MQFKTGTGSTVSVMTAIALWSLSLGVDLPGLAVTPMLDRLDSIFPNASELEVQLLTVLPNLLIIPFVLLSGRLSMSNHKTIVITTGVALYVLSAILYIFSDTMTELIIISALLGCACGLILPFSTGLIANVFTDSYRVTQMGIVSGIGNGALVVATFVVGLVASINWHMPFLVYLLPALSLFLLPWINKAADMNPVDDTDSSSVDTTDSRKKEDDCRNKWSGFYVMPTLKLLGSYFLFIYVMSVIPYYGPYLMTPDKLSTTQIGTVIALLYLAMFISGISLIKTLQHMRYNTYWIACAMIGIGMLAFILVHSFVLYCIGALLVGFGVGTLQPVIYDKATEIVDSPCRMTMAMAVILTANYLAISLLPIINDFFAKIFGSKSLLFPFIFSFVVIVVVTGVAFYNRRGFIFGIRESYYS